MGRDKLLLPIGGVPIIQVLLRAWKASEVDHVVAVVRASDVGLHDICASEGAEVVTSAIDPPEMKVSVQLGLRHIERRFSPESRDVWLLAPADLPHLSSALVNRLLRRHHSDASSIIAPRCSARRGHPVLFPWPLAADVWGLTQSETTAVLLDRHSVIWEDVEDGQLFDDVDTSADYRQLVERTTPSAVRRAADASD
jgi:molybdenum cofactor cytidylyltransferase